MQPTRCHQTQPKTIRVNPNAVCGTKSESHDSVDEKPVKGVFKTKTITIRRSKDRRTFKCSVCSTRASTLRELNAHFYTNSPECGL